MSQLNDFQMAAPGFGLKGTVPKIGIRPTIDGRRGGVRESLEDVCMGLAKAAADFLSSNLRHPDGSAVECVIADTCIGGVAEATACAEKFAKEGVGVSITVTSCWCYGSETMDMDQFTPKAVWGFNGTERPGAVYLAAVLAAHSQKGLPAYGIYGKDVKDAGDFSIPCDVQEKLLRFSKAGLAVAWMRGRSYLGMGGTSMGIAGSVIDPHFFEDYLGMRVEAIDLSEFSRRIAENIYDPQEFTKALAWVKNYCVEGIDPNGDKAVSAEKKAEVWEYVTKMAMIGRDLMRGNPRLAELGFGEEAMGHNAILAGFQGQRQWTDFLPNGDFLEATLNSSFDWNGVRPPILVATENDALNGVAMLFGNLLTNTASAFADVRTYWSPEAVERVSGWKPDGVAANGFIHLLNSGAAALDATGCCEIDGKPAMKPFYDIKPEEAKACMDNTKYCYAGLEYFRGGGYSSQFCSKAGMPVTLIRVNLIKGLGPVIQLAEGWTIELPEDAHNILSDRTNNTWPCTWFVPRLDENITAFKDVYSVMNNWGANHGSFNYGHIGADIITLAAMLRIPVCMHNVDNQDVYRPSAWGAFGTQDLEGADYRACANFGPLYKKI